MIKGQDIKRFLCAGIEHYFPIYVLQLSPDSKMNRITWQYGERNVDELACLGMKGMYCVIFVLDGLEPYCY